MIRALAVTVLLSSFLAFAQTPPKNLPKLPSENDPNNVGTEQQKCQAKCAEPMQQCMLPCLNGNPQEAAKPENRSKTMACVKKCADAQAPCLKACESKKKT